MNLEPYYIELRLETNEAADSDDGDEGSGIKTQPVKIPVLLPHEVFHAVHSAGEHQAWVLKSIFIAVVRNRFVLHDRVSTSQSFPWQLFQTMLGNQSPDAINKFWEHVEKTAEMTAHPALSICCDKSMLVPLLVHFDGTEMYRNCEYNVWSIGSAFSVMQQLDCLDTCFITCILPFSAMEEKGVAQLLAALLVGVIFCGVDSKGCLGCLCFPSLV